MAAHRLSRLPPWISHWLGYRSAPPPTPPQYIVYIWSFIGSFSGLAIIQAVFGHSKYFVDRSTIPIVASFGASAVLAFGAIEAPVAQPRPMVFGHIISALIGVSISKLFALLPEHRFESLQWLAGSLSTATALAAMQISNTVYPPAGATALLVATNSAVFEMGWYYLPVVLLSTLLMLVTALFINNIQRRYPVYWIEPDGPSPTKVDKKTGAPIPSFTGSNGNSQNTIDEESQSYMSEV